MLPLEGLRLSESEAQMQNDALAATPSEITSTTTTSADLSKGKGGETSDCQAKDEQNAKQLEEAEKGKKFGRQL